MDSLLESIYCYYLIQPISRTWFLTLATQCAGFQTLRTQNHLCLYWHFPSKEPDCEPGTEETATTGKSAHPAMLVPPLTWLLTSALGLFCWLCLIRCGAMGWVAGEQLGRKRHVPLLFTVPVACDISTSPREHCTCKQWVFWFQKPLKITFSSFLHRRSLSPLHQWIHAAPPLFCGVLLFIF